MNNSHFQRFFGKVLLFGEYAIINGAVGLAIPFDKYYMEFIYGKDEQTIHKSAALLKRYLAYVKEHVILENYDLSRFETDINHGLSVISTIPIGYGLGSSGALVAIFFHTYCINKAAYENINVLKKELGMLESFFHGASSGLDPLVSYLGHAVLIEDKDACSKLELPSASAHDYSLFILNSKIERRTAPLVDIFKAKMQSEQGFADIINHELIPLNNEIIKAYRSNDVSTGLSKIKQLSSLQLAHFKEMIPAPIEKIWREGLESGKYTMKICGAGGGGFFMGFGDASAIANYETFVF